ncbi:hypothetical protein ASF48_17690 [Rathayibacter sp. Leaf299]|uniref:hypothetical protein n=1 Tax=Rathayibacter sp. Leaf299 TaxID=1736328 RepID=UPI0006F8562E|nr:hypothetical protein [Rathayibacter sp. Leaf299]KQQ18751.1 hypothetical protein ASF48_17690 [Rathayibacter sp. Leaf299]
MSQSYVRYIGGEAGHRSFFGGTHSKGRVAGLGLFFVGGVIGLPLLGWPALLIAVAGAGITLLVTVRTHRGSIADRRRARRRWKLRQRTGTDVFTPYSDQAWEAALQAQASARGRTAKWHAARTVGALRAMPDGADGMGWLQSGRATPGIAWHAAAGEQEYLSVVFSVSGQLRGIESASVLNRAAAGWGAFLAGRAAPSSLARRVQTMTRVLPSDSAYQEHWAAGSLDTDIPADLEDVYRAAQQSYADVIRLSSEGAMVQRHYITVCWPVTAAFRDAASKYGPGREGWRALMRQEIAATIAGLTEARMGDVAALTARQVAAVMMHQQNPSRPIDLVAGLDPARPGLASHDEFSAQIVEDVDPLTDLPVTWWHRTARLVPESMAVAGRTPLWILDLLVGAGLSSVRSIAFHINLIPAAEAKASARQDLVRDSAEVLSRRQAGQIDVGDTQTAMSAAQRRSKDLVAGSNHHGTSWAGYVTISARTREDLSRASRELADLCSNSLGIAQLDWQDSYQAAASGATWPIGRGIASETTSLSARLYQGLAGTSEKEAL